MDRNSITGLILIAAVLFGFTFYQSKQAEKFAVQKAAADSVSLALQIQADSVAASLSSVIPDTAVGEQSVETAKSVYKDSLLELSHNAEARFVTIENDLLALTLTTRGAQPHSVRIKNFYCYDSTDLYIFNPGGCEYSASVFAGQNIQTKDFSFEIASLTDTSAVMRLPFSGGGYIEQRYVIHPDSYLVDNALSFVGMDGLIPRQVSSVDLDINMMIPRMEKGYKNETQYSKVDYYFPDEKKPSEFGRGRSSSKRIDSRLDWFAFQQQFFSAIVRAPKTFSTGELAVEFCPENDPERNLMNCSARMRADITPSSEIVIPMEFYFGPNHFNTLKSFDRKYEKIIPLGGWLVGWFTKYAIIPMFNFFHRFIDNFGLIILLMTIVIKMAVFPLMKKSYASSAKMAALKPEIDKINEKYPKQTQEEQLKKQQATMALYKRADASPMGGCLPTLLTFPILWAMFRFFPASIELRQQSFLWCDDLSAYDQIVEFAGRVPLIGDHISLFALLMAVTMWLYSKLTMNSQPGANDPSASSMRFMSLWMMPIMMFFICNSLSAALSYYYLLSQLISIIQTWAVRRSINPEDVLAKVRASEGKPLPKSKFQQRLEAAQKMQQEQLKAQQKKARR